MWSLVRTCIVVAMLVTVVGYASSFSINDGDTHGLSSISTGGITVEGCNANVDVDVNGGDSQDNAVFDEDARDFVIQSIAIDASRAEGGKSDCADREGKVWIQLMSGSESYGSVLGPETLRRGKAQFDNLVREQLLAGKITDVHVMIEMVK